MKQRGYVFESNGKWFARVTQRDSIGKRRNIKRTAQSKADAKETPYGHGYKHLATILALLMMLAFLVDQIQQGFNKLFQEVWTGLGKKRKLWESVRSVFQVLEFETIEQLYRQIALLDRILLE